LQQRRFGKPRRRRRIVRAAGAHRLLVLAGVGRLQQGEEKFPVGRGGALGVWRLRRQAAIGWINNYRRARAGALDSQERCVLHDAVIKRARSLLTRVVAIVGCALSVQYLPLRFVEEFLVGVPGRTL
jgi:hypothetical protein